MKATDERTGLDSLPVKCKDIKAMTMVRNDPFLKKWVEYYSANLGAKNLYVIFDGEDHEIPTYCSQVNCRLIPKMQGSVAAIDGQRARYMSHLAASLMAEGADMVIATDADEFLVVDPDLGMGLQEFLSRLPERDCHSGLGVDVFQNLTREDKIDRTLPFLQQRSYGWLHSRYTKASIITKPLTWGGGYHRVKGRNFHIAKGLYLFHFGMVDMERLFKISGDASRTGHGWRRHQMKRLKSLIKINFAKARDWDSCVGLVRLLQTCIRPIFAPNKPTTLNIKFVVNIPERFKNLL